jgi:3-hydroxyisobutyrate dehydrogenase-like beta-hydroxyacid dehydrogenase
MLGVGDGGSDMAERLTVAIVSPGEMGHAIGRVLGRRGARAITALEGRSGRTVELTQAAGIEDVGTLERVVHQADLLMSVLPSAAAPLVADRVAALLPGRTGPPLLFVDCNAMAPESVRRIATVVAGAGARVVDVGIVGGPPTEARSPKFYASGPHADELTRLSGFGLDVRPMGGQIGQASGLKMCYAALTKGLSALGAELLMTAEKMDLLDPLMAELRDSQATVLDWLERSVPGMPPKARRWVSEMEEIAATFAHEGQSPGYHRAASDLYRRVGQTELGHERPESRDTSRTLRAVIEELARSDARQPSR